MKTQCPISTISFNTKEFLINTLNQLNCEFWFAVEHFPEEDEKKKHFHVYIEPSCRVDTDSLRKALEQIVPNDELPLGCLPFRKSKFCDACLYFLHDKEYLASKFMSRKYHYTFDDVITNSFEFFVECYNLVDRKKLCSSGKFVELARQGVDFNSIVAQGYVPIPLIRQYKMFYNALVEDLSYRNNKNFIEHYDDFVQSSFDDLPFLKI